MASISKFNAAMLSVPNELTVAAANFNINFSLMKVESPPEFHGLKDALSSARRHEAEEGLPHVTARSLGALFESIIPPIPHLTAAYGTRVSEISQSMNTESQTRPHAGMFADRTGPDGTSIWAAATSGQSAIATHLLACMLARIWKAPEAISLWMELVERRKQQIYQTFDATNMIGTSAITAAQQIFTRQQLASWDSSARSWLQTADSAKRLQQTQLMLIINNVRMPVNAKTDPYESIVKAWTSALGAMEHLVRGIPQRVQDGSILLAISSWHLYPDMQVLSNHAKDIAQEDELMKGSVLTISSYGAVTAKEGVFWSLPLSRMRYYSPPVMAERQLASETSRVSLDEFLIVVLGAVISQWKTVCPDEERCCRFISALFERLDNSKETYFEPPKWLKILAGAAVKYCESRSTLRDQYTKLLKLGIRRSNSFLGDSESIPSRFFGLEHFRWLIFFQRKVEDKISFLRSLARTREWAFENRNIIIRYQTPLRLGIRDNFSLSSTTYDYASVFPIRRSSRKRSLAQVETPITDHCRWVIGQPSEIEVSCAGDNCGCIDSTGSPCVCEQRGARCTEKCHLDASVCSFVDSPLPLECSCPVYDYGDYPGYYNRSPQTIVENDDGDCPGCYNRKLQATVEEAVKEECFLIHPEPDGFSSQEEFFIKKPGETRGNEYGFLVGGTSAAIFQRKQDYTYDPESYESPRITATMDEIEAALSSDSLHLSSLCWYLYSWWSHWKDSITAQKQKLSLKVVTFVTSLYTAMPGTTINLEVIKTPLYDLDWAVALPEESLQLKSKHKDEVDLQHLSLVFSDEQQSICSFPESREEPQSDQYGGHPNAPGPQKELAEAEEELESLEIILARSFACIAWLESGKFDIVPTELTGVMALASGDSIYVATALLTDPSRMTHRCPIKRVFGNIGRSEMALLIPPSSPRFNEADPGAWDLINHSSFDCNFYDNFSGTSLHLTFTDYEIPLDVGTRGLRDRELILVEAVVSIDDRGKSIGDLDILAMLQRKKFYKTHRCPHTSELANENELAELKRKCGSQLISLDCWDEFLDPPPHSPGIFRATGNWQARLGAAAAGIQAGKRVFILPKNACLQCLRFINVGLDFSGFDLVVA